MTDATATLSDPPQPPPAVIAGDLLCVSCDYNLRGSREFGTCPECGADVMSSVKAHWLSHAYPDRARRIHAGLISLAVSVALTVGVPVLFLLIMLISTIGIVVLEEGPEWLLSIIILAEHAAWLAAAMLLQPPSPWRIILPRHKPQRAWLVPAALLNVLAMCTVLLGYLLPSLSEGVIISLLFTPLVFITRWLTVQRLGLVLLCHARDIVNVPQVIHTRRVSRGLLTGLTLMVLPAVALAIFGVLEGWFEIGYTILPSPLPETGGVVCGFMLAAGYAITYACTVWAMVYCFLFIRRFNRWAAAA